MKMYGYLKSISDWRKLKTNEFVFQDPSGNYPAQGAIGTFVDTVGTFGTSTVTIDSSGNLVVPGDLDVNGSGQFGSLGVSGSLDVSGTATLGDLRTRATKVHIGLGAGVSQGSSSIAIGASAGATGQLNKAVAIGLFAGNTGQGSSSVAIGDFAGSTNQSTSAVAIGTSAGINNQGSYSVAVGYAAGNQNQGANSIAIGFLAGNSNQGETSIVLNASGASLAGATGGFFVKPVRNITSLTGFSALYYNPTTGEICYN